MLVGVPLPLALALFFFFLSLNFLVGFCFWPYGVAVGISVPRPGIEPGPLGNSCLCFPFITEGEDKVWVFKNAVRV